MTVGLSPPDLIKSRRDPLKSCAAADAILLPKAEGTDEVAAACDELERARGGDGAPSPAIWCMRETQLGVLRAESLAAAPSVACLVAGTSDLSTDLRCDGAWSERQALLPALSQIVLAARAHGAACLDGVPRRRAARPRRRARPAQLVRAGHVWPGASPAAVDHRQKKA